MPTGAELKALLKQPEQSGVTAQQLKQLALPPLEVVDELEPPQSQIGPTTLDDRAQDVLGLDPNVQRLNLLPYPKGALKGQQGPVDWKDWVMPKIIADMAKGALLPGHAMQGGDYNVEDVVKFTLDYLLPATQMKGKTARPSKSQTIRGAPTTEELAKRGSQLLEAAKKSGASVDPTDTGRFLQGLAGKVSKEGLDPKLHPTASAALNAASKRLAQGTDMQDLMIARRQLGVAAGSTIPDERRLANIMIDELDDFVDNALPEASASARMGRQVWSQMKKSEAIEGVIEKARLSASGYENGLRTGFRSLLNNPKRVRGFSEQEKKLMQQIVKGTKTQNALRMLSKLSFGRQQGSNFLGGSIGVAGGAAVGGPAGAAAAPIIGQMARSAADANISQQADLARALAAGGAPAQQVMRPSALGPLIGTQMPQNRRLRRIRDDET